MCVLNREVERSSLTLEAFAHQHRLDQEKIENLSNKVRQLERTVTVRDLQLSETEQLVRELQYCTYDGIFVWKIPDFSRRRQDAVAGRAPAMFSPGEMKGGGILLLIRSSTPSGRVKAAPLHIPSHASVFRLCSHSVFLFLPLSVLLQQVRIQNVPEAVFEWRRDGPGDPPVALLCGHEGQV